MQNEPPNHRIHQKFTLSLVRVSILTQSPKIRKYHLKYISSLQIASPQNLTNQTDPVIPQNRNFPIPPPNPLQRFAPIIPPPIQHIPQRRNTSDLRSHQIRSLKNVKYIKNLHHHHDFYDLFLSSLLSQKRILLDNLKTSYPKDKERFLKKGKVTETLELLTKHRFLQGDLPKLSQATQGFSRLRRYGLPNNKEHLIHDTRKNRYILQFLALHLSKTRFLNFQLTNLQPLKFYNIEPSLLAIFLLKARSFERVQTIALRNLNIIKDFPSEMAQNFALFPNVTNLHLEVNLIDPELSREFLTKFTIGPSLKSISLVLNGLRIPNLFKCKEDSYQRFYNFAENLGSAVNLEDLRLCFSLEENFKGVNDLIAHLSVNLNKVKNLSLEFHGQGILSQFQEIRISMKPLLQWLFSMPQLETFKFGALNKDYTGLSSLVTPQVLSWKTFDIGNWSEEGRDTINPNDFTALMEIIIKAQKLERLNLSIESSHFSLDTYKLLIKSVKSLADLREVSLKLNCRKISLDDLELIEPALTHLKALNYLVLSFIVDPVEEVEIWRNKLCKSFEKLQKLGMFRLVLTGPKKPIFTETYPKEPNSQYIRRPIPPRNFLS